MSQRRTLFAIEGGSEIPPGRGMKTGASGMASTTLHCSSRSYWQAACSGGATTWPQQRRRLPCDAPRAQPRLRCRRFLRRNLCAARRAHKQGALRPCRAAHRARARVAPLYLAASGLRNRVASFIRWLRPVAAPARQRMSRRASLAEVKAALARDAAELGAPALAADASAAASAAAFEALLSAGDGGGDDAHLDAVGAWRSQATGALVAVRDSGSSSGPTARGRELYARARTQRQRREAARAIEDAAIRAAANPALSRCAERERALVLRARRLPRAARAT